MTDAQKAELAAALLPVLVGSDYWIRRGLQVVNEGSASSLADYLAWQAFDLVSAFIAAEETQGEGPA